MTIDSKNFASVSPAIRDEWMTVWTESAEQLDEGVVVHAVVDDEGDATRCVVMFEGSGLGEIRVALSRDDLAQSRRDVYDMALSVALAQARFATGF
jgi:hypothetical protein